MSSSFNLFLICGTDPLHPAHLVPDRPLHRLLTHTRRDHEVPGGHAAVGPPLARQAHHVRQQGQGVQRQGGRAPQEADARRLQERVGRGRGGQGANVLH